MPDVSDGSEDGAFQHYIMKDGTRIQRMEHSPSETVFNQDSADVDFRVESNGNANMLFVDAGNDRVGIGTSSPSDVLHVEGDIRVNNAIESAGNLNLEAENGSMRFQTGTGSPSERMRIDSSGNVGIGVVPENSSGTWRNLQFGGGNLVFRSNGANDAMIGTGYLFKTDNSEVYKNTEAVSRLFFDNNSMIFQQAGSGTANTAISWSEAMRIDSSGNLLVGHTSQDVPVDNGGAGVTLRPQGVMLIGGTGTSIYANREDSDGEIVQFRKDGTTVGNISTVSGNIKVSAYGEEYASLSGTSVTIDCKAGNNFALTTSGNTTFTFSNVPTSGTAFGFTLKLTSGGSHTITYPNSVDFAGATAPDAPASGETDILVFYTVDGGTNWYGALAIDAAG